MISSGKPSLTKSDILEHISEADILGFYLGIKNIPTVINNPLRTDKNPSMGLYSPDGKAVNYIDFATGDRGSCITLLMKMFNMSRFNVYKKIQDELCMKIPVNIKARKNTYEKIKISGGITNLACKIREWENYDIEYWESYGITLKWLKWAEVYPISYMFFIKDGNTRCYRAEKYAYAYVERKEGRITYKFYQPFSKDKKRKWRTNHDHSVISLWTKIPKSGDIVVICSSLKDALCLTNNLKIPCIALQGEGYTISKTAANVLKERFKNVCICFDNDKPGLQDSEKLSKETGFKNIIIPQFKEGKDISDYYHVFGKNKFVKTFKELFK